jgi:hypothetical protein
MIGDVMPRITIQGILNPTSNKATHSLSNDTNSPFFEAGAWFSASSGNLHRSFVLIAFDDEEKPKVISHGINGPNIQSHISTIAEALKIVLPTSTIGKTQITFVAEIFS